MFYYADDELKAMKNIAEDMRDKDLNVTYTAIAEKCIAYGACSGRAVEAVAKKVKSILNPEPVNEQIDINRAIEDTATINQLEQENKEIRNRLTELLKAVIGCATLDKREGKGEQLYLNIPVIFNTIHKYFPNEESKRIEALKAKEA